MALNIMQWNCRGVISKWAEIKPALLDRKCDIICLQETHFLPTDHYDFNLHSYSSYNCYGDVNRRQGGVCIYVTNRRPHFQVSLTTGLQAVACSIRIGATRLSVCSLYLPPNDRFSFLELNSLISQLPQPFVLCADANSRHYLWGSDRCDHRGNIWEQVIRRHALNVINTGCPTRMDEYSGIWSHIDITISSSDIGQYLDWRTDDDLLSSDHCPIYIDYHRNQRTTHPERDCGIRWNITKGNWTEFSDKCDLKFDMDKGPDNCTTVTQAIIEVAKQTVPMKNGKGKYNCPWWNDACAEALRLRKRALNRFRRSRQNVLLLEYKKAKAKARQVIRKAKKECWEKFLDQFTYTTPLSRLWDIIRRFTKKERFRRPLPVLKEMDIIIDDPLEVGNKLGQFFSDLSSSRNYRPVFRERARVMSQHLPDMSSDNTEIYNVDFTLEELSSAVASSGNTSVGPDSLHYMFFKQMKECQLSEILKLFNYVWSSGNFPEAWRHSTLIPILKPGKPADKVESYRPIQLTSCLSKVMERMIAKRMAWYVDQNNMISRYQSAFKKGRCTTDHLENHFLVRLESEVRRGFLQNKYTLAVFLDLKSAYNLTSTAALLTRMYELGFKGRFMIYLQEYLKRRTFQVTNGVLSDTFEQENGLVQGGVISPILFNIMIDGIFADIPDGISYALFADDCSMWVQGRHILPLIEAMQDALNRICEWTDQWGFVFSPQKCNSIIFRRYMKQNELANIPTLKIYDEVVSYSEEVKFLGVILDSRMNLNKHIKYLKAKALKRMCILKCLSGQQCGADRTTLLRIYKALIRPILDYACQILDGPENKTVESLDSVQNACLRIATGALRTSPIMPLLIDTDIYPLRLRRMDLTIRYGLKIIGEENHPCHALTTRRETLHRVNRSYMVRMSGIPFHERLRDMCNELQFAIPTGITTPRLSVPPWMLRRCITRKLIEGKGENFTNVQILSAFRELRDEFTTAAFIFTDGSKGEAGVGCAFVHRELRRRFKLPDLCSIFTAEATAVLRALEYVELNALKYAIICTDSLAVVTAVKNITSNHPTLIDILLVVHRLMLNGYDICIMWIPGHCNITGNEIADTEAKSAMTLTEVCDIKLRFKEYLPILRNDLQDRFAKLWADYPPNTTLKAIKGKPEQWETSTRTSRREEIVLCRLRLGHTRITHSYLLDRDTRPECEHCRSDLSVQHILMECPHYAPYRIPLVDVCQRYGLPYSLRNILGNSHSDIIDSVFHFLQECHLLQRL